VSQADLATRAGQRRRSDSILFRWRPASAFEHSR